MITVTTKEAQTGYEPDTYWEARGGESYQEYVESPGYAIYREEQMRFFRELVASCQPERLLDFGCGTGKLFRAWVTVPEVHGFDRARSQIAVARAAAARVRPDRPYRAIHSLSPSRTELPYDDDYFDLVVTAEVLLHVVPDDIGNLIDELHRVCRGRLAIVTAAPFRETNPHCFNHDYPRLLERQFVIEDDHAVHAQRYIVARKIRTDSDVQTQTGR